MVGSMVKILFEGRNLADCDFFTKSDPYLILSRPKHNETDKFIKVSRCVVIIRIIKLSFNII